MKKIFVTLFILLISFSFMGCNNTSNEKEPDESSHFYIYLIDGKYINELPYDYSDEKWVDFINQTKLKNIFISDTDIESYDWNKQIITLTKEASNRIKENLSKDKYDLFEKSFIVSLKGTKYYAGSILEVFSARAINYPVIYIEDNAGVINLYIRHTHSGDLNSDYQISENDVINKEEIKIFFQQINKLTNSTGLF